MRANYQLMAIVILLVLTCTASSTLTAKIPPFKSGASTEFITPVNFDAAYGRVNSIPIYEIVEHNASYLIWKLSGTTGDWVFAYPDRLIIASVDPLDMPTYGKLHDELYKAVDLLNTDSGASPIKTRGQTYYSESNNVIHRLDYTFETPFKLFLAVPNCIVKSARFKINGQDSTDTWWDGQSFGLSYAGQNYMIDGKSVTHCTEIPSSDNKEGLCGVSPVDITDKIPPGEHSISSERIHKKHTMIIEAVTSSTTKEFMLYGEKFKPWINETTKSLSLNELYALIQPNTEAFNTTSKTQMMNATK